MALFYINTKTSGNFRMCISVSLTKVSKAGETCIELLRRISLLEMILILSEKVKKT